MKFSNVLTEILQDKPYNFNIEIRDAFKTKLEEPENFRKYFLKTFEEITILTEFLSILRQQDFIKNSSFMEMSLENSEEIADDFERKEIMRLMEDNRKTIKESLEYNKRHFSDITVLGKNIMEFSEKEAKELIKILSIEIENNFVKIEKQMPQSIIDFLSVALSFDENKNFTSDFAYMLNKEKIFNSKMENLSKTNFAYNFIILMVKKLCETDDLDVLENVCSDLADLDSKKIFYEVFIETAEELLKTDHIIKAINIARDEYLKFINVFIERNLQNKSGVFLLISNFLLSQKGGLHEFYNNFYSDFGNIITLPITDELRNCMILSDDDLINYCNINEFDFNDFLIDISQKLENGYYFNPDYDSSIELKNKNI